MVELANWEDFIAMEPEKTLLDAMFLLGKWNVRQLWLHDLSRTSIVNIISQS
jgi:hypothetical protein